MKINESKLTEFKKNIYQNLPKDKQKFIENQLIDSIDDMFHGDLLMPVSGICYVCGYDIITHRLDEQDNSLVTGCPKCYTSFCD